ncbi:MAG: NAD-dependent epimerase/dehydratase family protein, partial [Candidatus Thorarchaeota archaeon]
ASTLGVYGFKYPKYPVSETHRINPANNYQESKFLAEQYLMSLNKEQGIDTSAIRNSLIVGPRDTVTSIRVSQGLLNGQISFIGNGNNTFSMVDARDSSKAMILCSKLPQSKGQAYNVKSFDVSQNDYFNYYASACGGCYPKRRIPVPIAKTFAWYKEKTTPKGKEVLVNRTRVDRYTNTRLLDTTKIETELGYKPDHGNPEEVIKESVEWLYNNNYLKR